MSILAAGLLHGELTSLLWGGAFGFLWAYVFVARTATSFVEHFRAPRGTLEAVPGPVLVFRTDTRPTAPAFFGWWLRVEGVHSTARRFERRAPLADSTTLALELPRGVYRVTARWELTDVFGFTRLLPRARWETVVTVEPGTRPFVPPPPPPTRPGPWRPRRSGRRTGDPFDVRAYTPGDDLRRLHWPLYAHSDTLFVRTAEPSPPPAGHQFLVLDTEAASEEELDGRLESLRTWLNTLDAQGTGWSLVVPAADLVVEAANLGPGLAGLVPAPLPDRADPAWPEVVTLLTGPRSAGGARLARLLAATRRRLHPVVVEVAASAPAAARPWWRRP